MVDNSFFKEVFEREFSRLQATGINKQSAAAQALVSAQHVVTEMLRHQHLVTPSSNILSETSVNSTDSSVNTINSAGVSSQSALPTSAAREAIAPFLPLIDSYDQDKRKGKLAANVYSILNKKIPAARIVTKVPPPIDFHDLKRILSECLLCGDFSPIIRLVGSTFSSADSLNGSFYFPMNSTSSSASTPSSSSSSLKSCADTAAIDITADLSGSLSIKNIDRLASNETTSFTSSGLISQPSSSIKDIESSLQKIKYEDKNIIDLQNGIKNIPLNLERISIDIDQVTDVFKLLFNSNNEGIQNSLHHALVNLSYNMSVIAPTCTTGNSLKHILIVLEHPHLLDPKYEILLRNILIGINKLPSRSKKMMALWYRDSAGEKRFKTHLTIFRQFMTLRIMQG